MYSSPTLAPFAGEQIVTLGSPPDGAHCAAARPRLMKKKRMNDANRRPRITNSWARGIAAQCDAGSASRGGLLQTNELVAVAAGLDGVVKRQKKLRAVACDQGNPRDLAL